jgi:hypothetical protein
MTRPKPINCWVEPPFPGLHTCLCTHSAPNLTLHRPSKRCAEEGPHEIANCGEFQPGESRQ